MLYTSTRDSKIKVNASKAILQGLSKEGGLFVPTEIPKLNKSWKEIAELSYKELAYEIMQPFFSDFTKAELEDCINKAYDDKFDTSLIAPLVKVNDAYHLELFHGSTIAFKDMALSILPHLLVTSAKKNFCEDEIVILTATSGDTGKAAMAGFADVEGTKIIVFYPEGGVSEVQEKQMLTQTGDNTYVFAVRGNFDDAQTAVKDLFNNQELGNLLSKHHIRFSSANSINIGRLVPQIVYYIYAYGQMIKHHDLLPGEKINICVPTGNFGNILAAYYGYKMGLPVGKLICASNDNKVLYDFFESGEYNKNREFILTSSPSMDILISSNLERLIYHIAGDNAEITQELMKDLKEDGHYTINEDMKHKLSNFYGGYANETQVGEEIKKTFEKTGYIMDTHTAVASYVYHQYKEDELDANPTVIASTASPFKFANHVISAIQEDSNVNEIDEIANLGKLQLPKAILEIRERIPRDKKIIEISDMKENILKVLNIVGD